MRRTSPTVHCWRTKSEALQDAWEAEHPDKPFVGSDVWKVTLSRDWREGVCRKAADHIDGCTFEDIALPGRRVERKAS